jgi:hypothetical protein
MTTTTFNATGNMGTRQLQTLLVGTRRAAPGSCCLKDQSQLSWLWLYQLALTAFCRLALVRPVEAIASFSESFPSHRMNFQCFASSACRFCLSFLSDSTLISIIKEVVSLKEGLKPVIGHVIPRESPGRRHHMLTFTSRLCKEPPGITPRIIRGRLFAGSAPESSEIVGVWCRFGESMITHPSSSPSASQSSVYPTFSIGSEDYSRRSRKLRSNMNSSPACTMLTI